MHLNKLILSLLLCLTALNTCICSSSLNATEETIQTSSVVYEFENGMHCFIQPAVDDQHGLFITLSLPTKFDEKERMRFYLLQYSLFSGTVDLNESAIVDILDSLSLNTHVENYIVYNEFEQSLRFSLFDKAPDAVSRLLGLLKQVTFSPLLDDVSIELGRNLLLNNLILTDEEKLDLETITAEQVREAYATSFQPKNLNLALIGATDKEALLATVTEIFGSVVNTIPIESLMKTSEQEEQFEFGYNSTKSDDRIQIQQDGSFLIDGKIRMKAPSGFFQSKHNGYLFGGMVLCLAAVAALSAIVIGPTAIIPVMLCLGTGGYFFTASYVNDPYYIAKARTEDLAKGSAFAYQKGRIQYTLTPLERRLMFIQELLSIVPNANKSALSLLVNVYQLDDPVIYNLFTFEELNGLRFIKTSAITESNAYHRLVKELEDELVRTVAPYAKLRDERIENARYIYEHSYPFLRDQSLNEEIRICREDFEKEKDLLREEYLKDCADVRLDDTLSADEKEKLLADLKKDCYYDLQDLIKDFEEDIAELEEAIELNLVALEMLKVVYENTKAQAQKDYAVHYELCKVQINYDVRMASYKQGISMIMNYYNQQLQNLLMTFPQNPLALPDYISRV